MTTPEEQNDLLERCLARQTGAWEAFVDRFAGLIVHVVKHAAASRGIHLAEQDIEDQTAEVFLQLIDRDMAVLRAFRQESSLATYLTVIARRIVVRDLLSRREILSVLRQRHLKRQEEQASAAPPVDAPPRDRVAEPPPIEAPPASVDATPPRATGHNGNGHHHPNGRHAGRAVVASPESVPEPDNPLERIDDEDLIESMLATLDDREAEVLRLRYRDDLSYEEIHARTGIAENSIGPLISRAKEKLRTTRAARM